MLFRFYFQLIVGLISMLAILFLGESGLAFLALFALLPIIMRIKGYTKFDERELNMFYKIGNYTLIVVIVTVILINKFSSVTFNGITIGEQWDYLLITSLWFGQGLVGVIIYYLES